MRVLFTMLDNDHDKKISKNDMELFFINPEGCNFLKVKEVWVAEQHNLQDLYERIRAHLQNEKINLKDLFNGQDKEGTSKISFEELKKVFQNVRMPLNNEEMNYFYETIQKDKENKMDYNNLLEKINPSEEKKFVNTIKIEKNAVKWEAKAREIHKKYKEIIQKAEILAKEKRSLEEIVAKDTKQKQIFELQKKIESLENVIHERDAFIRKKLAPTNSSELVGLKKNYEKEKEELNQVIESKNQEIKAFKSELDLILSEMEKMKKKKSIS